MFDVFKKMLRASVGLVIAGLGIYITMQARAIRLVRRAQITAWK